jgi:hypothetical protein
MQDSVYWDVTPSSPVKSTDLIFRVDEKAKQEINVKHVESTCYLLREGFLLDLFLGPEYGGDTLLRNIFGRHETCRKHLPPASSWFLVWLIP